MTDTLNKIYSISSREEKKQMLWLLAAILIMGLLETTGIASIMPFIAVITNPDIITSNKHLFYFYNLLGFSSPNGFLFFLGIAVLAVLLVSNSFSAFTSWLLLRFIYFSGHTLSCRLFSNYLNAPYSFFLNHNSAELTKNILTEVHRVVVGVLTPAMQIITRSIVALCILGLLIAMDPLLALMIFMICGGSYAIVFKFFKSKLTRTGKNSTQAQGDKFKLASEAFGGIKELKLLDRESEFINRYFQPSYKFAACESTKQAITILPKYALEAIIFGGILVIMIYQIGIKSNIAHVLPILALYAFAGYRLMPSFNQIFQGLSLIRYHSAPLDIIYNHSVAETTVETVGEPVPHSINPLPLNDRIELKHVDFKYPQAHSLALNDLNLLIKANTTVAFVGKTGSGKTTLIDIILGLLPVTSGDFVIDNQLIDSSNLKSWQKNIGYVPQQIFLADDTVTSNIAFGLPDEELDFEAVKHAARLANIDDFVTRELADGYNTNLGERGVRLSGGQRQRIGIARALYHDPKVLVLDEATSALDGITENAVMDAIHNLTREKTIIMIAHRITTIKECDTIYVMEDGAIIANGYFDELTVSCPQFREMSAKSAG